MGRYTVNPSYVFYVTGPLGYTQLLGMTDSNGHPLVATIDKFSPGTLVSGSLAAIDGSGILVSQWIREDLNRFGVYDGVTTDSTMLIACNRRQFIFGSYRGLQLKTREAIETDQLVLVATQRSDFVCAHPVASAVGVPTGYIYGIRST